MNFALVEKVDSFRPSLWMENGIFNVAGHRTADDYIANLRASRSRYFFHGKGGETRRSGMAGLEHVLETLHGRLFP